MKKNVTITVIVLFLGVFAFLFFIPHPAISYNKELFIENKSYYDDVVKMCKEYYKESKRTDTVFFSSANDGESLYCYHNKEYYPLTDEQRNSFKMVEETFRLDHQSLEDLIVTDEYVVFNIVNGRASFIYSDDNSKPNFVNTPKVDSQHIYVEKIVDNWYFACNQD